MKLTRNGKLSIDLSALKASFGAMEDDLMTMEAFSLRDSAIILVLSSSAGLMSSR